MTDNPASASGDQPPAKVGLTVQELTARLEADGELSAEDIVALARLDDRADAGGGCWDDSPDASGRPWDDDPGPALDGEPPDDGQASPPVTEVWDAGFNHHIPGEPGYGFASGGLLDRMLPGRELAAFTGTALRDGLDRLSDGELIGFLCATHRNTSWQQAAELTAVTNLDQRRAGTDGAPGEHVTDEVAAALKLTPRAADGLLALAAGIARLSQVPAALATGLIDRARAEVFVRELLPLDDELAVRAEAMVMPRAPDLTTGQLAWALQQAVAAVDPAAAERRKKRSEQDARVEVWIEPGRGTAAVAGRDLPATEVIAADKRLTAAARWLKARGADGTMDWLRSRAYLAFINGYSLDNLLAGLLASEADAQDQRVDGSCDTAAASGTDSASAAPSTPGSCGVPGASGAPTADDSAAEATVGDGDAPSTGCPAGGTQLPAELATPAAPPGLAALAGTVNLTMPALAWIGLSDVPGEAGGFGALDAGTCRDLTAVLAANPATRWCVTIVDRQGRATAHGCAREGPGPSGARDGPGPPVVREGPRPPGGTDPAAWLTTVKISPIETGTCSHRRESAGYQPSNSLRHIIKIRSPRCGFPGCRRPAIRCDDDHTIPYDKGGRTCECNLHPLCRRHHQAKQAPGWRLEQPEPGVLIWYLPHGRSYAVRPEPYPV